MTTFTVWKFEDPEGAAHAATVLKDAQADGLVKIVDHAVMSWPPGADKPETHHKHDDPKRGAAWGALWGILGGALFAIPVAGAVAGVAIGALAKSTEGTGITKEDLARIRTEVVEGTRRCSWSPRTPTWTGWVNASGSTQHADHHQPHRRRARHAHGDVRRGLIRPRPWRPADRPHARDVCGRSAEPETLDRRGRPEVWQTAHPERDDEADQSREEPAPGGRSGARAGVPRC